MKKIITTLAILIVVATTSFAQVGVRIGMDFAKLTGDLSDVYKSNVGLHLGVVYNYELADALSLQPGIFYVQRNWAADANDDWKLHTHHIEVPIVLKYNLDITSDIAIDPHVGPYFGFGFAGKCKDDKDFKIFKKVEKGGMGYTNFDMGVQFGVGATFFETAYVGFDYELGFRDVIVGEPKGANVTSHNSMFMITFGVFIPE